MRLTKYFQKSRKTKEKKMQTASKVSTAEERERVVEFWIQYVRPSRFPDLVVDGENGVTNGRKIATYIEAVHQGHWEPNTVTEAVRSLQNNLIGLGVATTTKKKKAAQKTAEAAAKQRAEQIDAHNQATIVKWLRDECPLGLIVNGDLYGTTQDKVIAFIKRTLSGKELILTPQLLSDAVATLGPALDWFSRASEDVVLRNQPAPPTREQKLADRLSEKAKREGGLLPIERQQPSHVDTDKPLKSAADLVKFLAQEELKRRGFTGAEDPEMIAADQISVTNRYGKLDHAFNSNLKKIFARNADGSVNTKKTKEARLAAATEYERRRNRDGGQRG
jgi:hypothetical protein